MRLLLQVFLTSSHLVLAMEYAAGGDLFRYVSARRGLPEDEARWFFQQLMIAVDYCHRMVRSGVRVSSGALRLSPAKVPRCWRGGVEARWKCRPLFVALAANH